MKKVWIISIYSNAGSKSEKDRFHFLADLLQREGIDVTLILGDFSHITKTYNPPHEPESYDYNIQVIHQPYYKKHVSLKRAYSHIRSAFYLKKKISSLDKPDLIYCAYPPMVSTYLTEKFALKNDIPLILDIEDTWPESISAALDIRKLWVRVLMWPFTRLADKIYSLPDAVFGVSKTYVDRARVKNSRCKTFTPVYLGADIKNYDSSEEDSTFIKEPKDTWITYIGTLSHSYDIDTAIHAFSSLKNRDIKLNILGSGPDFDYLVDLAKRLKVFEENVFFHGRLPYKKMVSFLKKTDIALNSLTADSKGTITTKLGDYIVAGLPLLNSSQEQEVKNLIKDHKLGFNYTPKDPQSLIDAIDTALQDKEVLKSYGRNSKNLALLYFDRETSYKKITCTIKKILYPGA